MSDELKACAVGCPTAICSRVDRYKKNDNMSERGACRKLAIKTNEFAKCPDLFSDAAIRHIYRNAKGLRKKPDAMRPPWTGQYETYTPKKYIESVRVVMSGIDLDPASCKEANKTVKADRFFDISDNGLKQDWFGRVFLNPPYKQPEINHFISKLVDSYVAGMVSEAVLLTNNNTDTNWFNIASSSSLICFTDHRIKFELKDGELTGPTTGQAFYYFGHHKQQFIDEFRNHGLIFERQ